MARADSIKVPLIQTKFKQLAKSDVAHEIRMSESERLSVLSLSGLPTGGENEENGRGWALMWIYVLICAVVMYFMMHPSSKVRGKIR